MSDELIVERDDGWLTLWMNRPEVRNALGADMLEAMRGALEAVRDDRTV
ncbi:MAG: enoyl-CoA hydratase/isomerase family protein, partial [Rhodospirillaceae bacterium]|nr:enoyl-CoA hydratase/isomerase family protein [Rhodospirillaceae bacterium]